VNLGPASPILLVDDSPANLLALEAVLQALGEPLVRAGSGQEALRRLRDADFAAVLLDVRMPGMDGFEAARLIRAQRRSRRTPIIFVTADASDLSVEAAYAIGAVDFLTKPLVPSVLKAKLAFFVELHRSRQELQAAERKVVQDRAFLAAVLEAVEDGIVACGADGKLTLFNRATRGFHGMPPGMTTADDWSEQYDLYRADGVTPLPQQEIPLVRALAGEVVREAEIVIAPKGGVARHLLSSGQPLYDEAGHKLGAVVSMHDVSALREAAAAREAALTEQTRREEAEAAAELIRESRERLRASEERVRLATDAAGLGLWILDVTSATIAWENERLVELFGLAVDDEAISTQRFAAELAHPDDAARLLQTLSESARLATPLRFEGRFRRRSDRALRWIELTGIVQAGPDGSPRRILGTAADITDRKQAEEELRRSEERYRTLFESIDEGFCVIQMLFDAEGRAFDYRFLEVNPAFGKHTGLKDAVGKTMREMAPAHEQHWYDLYGRVARTGESLRFENEAKALNRWYDVHAVRLGGASGSDRVAILFKDITERRRSEENLRRLAAELAETDRLKTEFLATLAHELRNPLAPLSNGLQLMRMAADPQALEEARGMMERQLKHLVRLVDDLLDIARISSGKMELRKQRTDLNAVLASAVETSMPLVRTAGHTLSVQLSDENLEVVADATRIAQVVSNLLNNAVKYTPDGGRIELAARREDGEAVVTVTDTGIGIAPQALPQVFEMFTQVGPKLERAPGGLGIGLALVRRLVELHGGRVLAESPGMGGGSTFTVRLPLAAPVADAAAAAAPLSGEAIASSAPAFRVLVVDDNVDAAESLAALLELQGHATRVAHDGNQALAAAHDFRPEIVFLDIGMPGKDGYQVARELRRQPETRQAVLVALTGWGAQDDRARTRNAGFDHHLTKPAGLADVEGLMSRVAERRPAETAPSS
jgi:PAS domain S-box-containing protein